MGELGGALSEVVAVTGGTGFIGSHLVHRLVADGVRVRALARRPAAELPEPLRHPNVTLVSGDVTDALAVRALVAGARRVFHLAGCARAWTPDPGEYAQVNVVGTEHVCRESVAAGVEVLLHTSTNLVERAGSIDAEKPMLTEYQRTKREAEKLVERFRKQSGLSAVVVRPARVYGPGPLTQANSATLMMAQYRRGTFRVCLADGGARANWVFVKDVVAGMVAAADARHNGGVFTLAGENASVATLLGILGEFTGRRRLVFPISLGTARVVAALSTQSARLGATPIITRDWVDLLARDWPSFVDPATRALGYRPRSLADGVRETVAWLESGSSPW